MIPAGMREAPVVPRSRFCPPCEHAPRPLRRLLAWPWLILRRALS